MTGPDADPFVLTYHPHNNVIRACCSSVNPIPLSEVRIVHVLVYELALLLVQFTGIQIWKLIQELFDRERYTGPRLISVQIQRDTR